MDPTTSPASKSTAAGNRAVVYESGPDGRGIVGVFDFCADAVPDKSWGWAAFGIFQPLTRPVARVEIRGVPVLRSTFLHPQGRRGLTPEQGEPVAGLIAPLPRFLQVPALIQTEGLDFEWDASDPGRVWGTEKELQEAIAVDGRSRRVLGLVGPLQLEPRSEDGKDRYDIVSDGVVVECKQIASLRDLTQLDRYLTTLRREHPEQSWTGHLVFGRHASRSLVLAIEHRADVQLWECRKRNRMPC